MWFVGGMVLALGARLTGMLLLEHQSLAWLTSATAGTVFVAIELVAHGALHLRGRPSFYNGLG